jgi:hypothetical protein
MMDGLLTEEIFPPDIIPAGKIACRKIRMQQALSVVSAAWKWWTEIYLTEKREILFFCYLYFVYRFQMTKTMITIKRENIAHQLRVMISANFHYQLF